MSFPSEELLKSNLRSLIRAKVEPREVLKMIHDANVEMLTEEEEVKEHPLKGIKLLDADFSSFKKHLLDGGGSIDKNILAKKIVQDLLDNNNSAELMGNIIHYVKSCLKLDGIVIPTGEGVRFNGVGITPPANNVAPPKEKKEGVKENVDL